MRECPALDRERQVAKERRAERDKRKRARSRRERCAARDRARDKEHVLGIDLRQLMGEWCRLKAWHVGGHNAFAKRGEPTLIVRRGADNCWHPDWHPAHAWIGRHRITMTIPRSWTAAHATPGRVANVLVTLLHEMAHLAVRHHHHGESHGDAFNQLFCAAAEEVWGIEVGYRYGDGGYGPTRRVEELLRGAGSLKRRSCQLP